MAFESAIIKESVFGDMRIRIGTYTNGSGDTGGEIVTGLTNCDYIELQPIGSAVIATQSVVNETFPLASGSITVVTADNEDGTWFAIGK